MTAKEQAQKLFDKFYSIDEILSFNAKQCALICCDEVIAALDYPESLDNADHANFWEDVRAEIEKIQTL